MCGFVDPLCVVLGACTHETSVCRLCIKRISVTIYMYFDSIVMHM